MSEREVPERRTIDNNDLFWGRRSMAHSQISTPEIQGRHTFKYTRFTDSTSIRILTLFPGGSGDSLRGELSVEDLASAQPYETVSYVWGLGGRCAELICNSEYLSVTQSAHDALARIRSPDTPRRVWADQICINQDDVAERSQQVPLMNSIYHGSDRVLVWLGKDPNGIAPEAMKMVRYLNTVFEDETAHQTFRQQYSEELLAQNREPWIPLSKLTKLPWFSRIWIVQEIGTASSATLFWGDSQIEWDELSSAAAVLNVDYHSLRTHFQIYTPSIRYLHKRFVVPEAAHDDSHNRGNFVYELHRARHMEAKDPRDRVYAFLGHYTMQTNGSALASLKPDYSRMVEEVYIDVAIRSLKDASSLILLAACQPCGSPKRIARIYRRRVYVPTWVPDWRILPLHMFASPTTPHKACGDTSPRLDIDENKRLLHIIGVRVDTISRCFRTFQNGDFQMQKTKRKYDSHYPTSFEEMWTKVSGQKEISLNARYRRTKEPAFVAMTQTLTNGCIGVDRSQPYEEIPTSRWTAAAASYLLHIRDGNYAGITEEVQALAAEGEPFKWSHEATLVTRYRRFAISSEGYYVLGSDMMEKGDVIVVLYGGRTPFVLRPQGDTWALLGECYAHGLMNGEAFKLGEKEEVFTIV
ncbi:hypothetical protein V2G26_001302 [Clonostachys chloroleuca]